MLLETSKRQEAIQLGHIEMWRLNEPIGFCYILNRSFVKAKFEAICTYFTSLCLWKVDLKFSVHPLLKKKSPQGHLKYENINYSVTLPWLPWRSTVTPKQSRYVITQFSSVAQSCLTLYNPLGCIPPGSSVHRIFQARILEWVAFSSSRGSSHPRDRTCIPCVSCIAGRFFTCWAIREALNISCLLVSLPGFCLFFFSEM